MLQINAEAVANKSVTCFIDNTCAEAAFRNKRCLEKRKDISRLGKSTCLFCSYNNTRYWSERISSEENILADDLSRFNDIRWGKQNAKFGSFPMTKQLGKAAVIEKVKSILGHLWDGSSPPRYGILASK